MIRSKQKIIASVSLLGVAFALSGCITPVNVVPGMCTSMRATTMLDVHLMFGLTKPNGQAISDDEWNSFTQNVVTPLFPSGFSVIAANGQWKDTVTGSVTREPSRILWIATPDRPNLQHDLNLIRERYKQDFAQQAVGLTIATECASF
ncbi:DUF3574 domain-containing protein [Neokomagataea tanensis]|uniref:DUF3574 domain-containing protein n=2 Tax=Neokomagataea TaxID=1223423 RepID=A0A4Y6V9X6_9PROT|nr:MULTISPECIES: DUF3574 domain-containing protein [Neokomagataea]QDH25728.1 DUF3574 domain-containing protein [Neokomagataea tanensis]